MADLNKVIESLEFCAAGAECDHCKYAQENKGDYEGCHHLMADAVVALLKSEPQIVRCKDCAIRRTYYKFCPEIGASVQDDFFCGWGKPKDGDGE